MASIARRTLLNLLDCIRCFFLRNIDTSTAWIPLNFYTDQRYMVYPTKGIIDDHNQDKDWNVVQMQTKTAKMLLNITQTVQEMQQTATVALITASLTTPVGSILLTAPTPPKIRMEANNKGIDIDIAKCASLPEISCSLIDSSPTYCYFIINSCSSNNKGIKKSFKRTFGAEKLRKFKTTTDTETEVTDNDNNNRFKEDDVVGSTVDISSVMLPPRQRTYSESSDDNFICFVDDDDDDDDNDLDCKASSGSSKNYGYYSNQYDTETDYSDSSDDDDEDDDSCDDDEDEEEDEEDEDCVMMTEKKVRFDPKPKVHVMHTWNFAYRSARKGHWENVARDRVRFQNRIQRASAYLDPILAKEHRQKIYEDRFANVTENSRIVQEPNKIDKPFLN